MKKKCGFSRKRKAAICIETHDKFEQTAEKLQRSAAAVTKPGLEALREWNASPGSRREEVEAC